MPRSSAAVWQQNDPATGWVFPAGSVYGHREESSAKIYHGEAVKKLAAASAAYAEWKEAPEGDWMDAVKAATKLEPELP